MTSRDTTRAAVRTIEDGGITYLVAAPAFEPSAVRLHDDGSGYLVVAYGPAGEQHVLYSSSRERPAVAVWYGACARYGCSRHTARRPAR